MSGTMLHLPIGTACRLLSTFIVAFFSHSSGAQAGPYLPGVCRNAENRQSSVGVNIVELSYWSSQWALIDIMKHASNGRGGLWATGNADTFEFDTGHGDQLDVDDQGWPRSLPERDDPGAAFHHVTTILYQDNEHHPVGEFIVLYEGQGSLRVGGGARMLGDRSVPGRAVVEVGEGSGFHLTIGETDPASTGDYIRNIRVLVPGGICDGDAHAYGASPAACPTSFTSFEALAGAQVFHPQFLADMRHYRAVRTMQMQKTNVTTHLRWQDRPQWGDASWAGQDGVPLEVAVELANELDADAWLTLPARVDDTYFAEAAELVRSRLAGGHRVYIELGNEIWNSAYPYNRDALWMSARGREAWPGLGVSEFEYRLNYYGRRSQEMCQIWQASFEGQAERLHCVIGAQSANAWVAEQTLSCPLWPDAPAEGRCGAGVSSLAIGPYFAGYLAQDRYLSRLASWLADPVQALDQLFSELHSGLLWSLTHDPSLPDWMQAPEDGALAATQAGVIANQEVAEQFGLELTAYEGGQHMTYAGNMAGDRRVVNDGLFLAANRDPRMGDAYRQHLEDWRAAGGGLYMAFESVGGWGRFGAFPLKEYQLQPAADAVKYTAVRDYVREAPCGAPDCARSCLPGTGPDCEIEPDHPLCQGPPDCQNNPQHPLCQGPPDCELEPDHPFCQGPPDCEADPDHPLCQGPPDCEADPGHPLCQGPPDCEAEPTHPDCPPPVTLNLTATALVETRGVRLSWQDVGPEVAWYKVLRDGTQVTHRDPGVGEVDLEWLTLGRAYDFQIVAVAADHSVVEASEVIRMMPGDSLAPSVPAPLEVEWDGAFGFHLSWAPAVDDSGVMYYKIFRNGQPLTHVPGQTLSWHDQWPGQGQQHRYEVYAEDPYQNRSEGSGEVLAPVVP